MRAHLIAPELEDGQRQSRTRFSRTPPGYEYPIGRILVIYSGLMLTMFLAALDQTIVATALPAIVDDVGGLASYSWVFSAYLLFQTVTIPIYGKLADVYGTRRMLLLAITIFLTGSALCGAAANMSQLIVFRSIQGIGGGGLIPLAHTTIAGLVPPRDRGRYQGLISGAFGAASVLGPGLGGLIVDHTTWRWIFLANIPIGLFALAVVAITMPLLRRTRSTDIDIAGAILLAGGTGGLLFALLRIGRAAGGSLDPAALTALVCALLLLAALVVRERQARDPILSFGMLRLPTVGASAACTMMAALCQMGTIAFVPLFLQAVAGSSASSSGLVLMPLMLGAVAASVISGQLISRYGRYRPNALVGPVVLGAAMVLLSRMDLETSTREVARNTFIAGVGMGLMMSVFIISSQNAAPRRMLGATTALIQFARAIGTTIGVTVFGVVINQSIGAGITRENAVGIQPALRLRLADAIQHAFIFAICVCIVLFATSALGIKQLPLRRSLRDHEPDEDGSRGQPDTAGQPRLD